MLVQRRIQELAVRCIQRNVRAFLKVRGWPWWRLLVRVTPLLNVHRTEEQLKSAIGELQILKIKLEKSETERNNLKAENSKLESRLSEMTSAISEEHSSLNIIGERLEAETTERLRLMKEVNEHEIKYRELQKSTEKLEIELMFAKSDLISDFDDDIESDDAATNTYRLKYERVARELEFTKKRLQAQHEHDLEQLIGLKKQLEKKLADVYEEIEEQRQVANQWKRKAQKMNNEMNDLRMLLEEQNSRNNLLEKRQRKFDSECQALQDSVRYEKQNRERLAREKDVLGAEKFTTEQLLSDVRLELELKQEKCNVLQRELEEVMFGAGSEEDMAQLKRQKLELDRRCKEQEEELDDMAGQIQLLEQANLRLEISLETIRKDARKETQLRDDELEEIRGSLGKKIRSLECQLEQEYEKNTLLLREKHELERRVSNLEEDVRNEKVADEAASQKIKRDLKKCKALLRDAQNQLERTKADSVGKALIRQLRNQLEDAESARSTAVKCRQIAETDLRDTQLVLEEAQRVRYEAEEKALKAHRDRVELQEQIDENEEELSELMKKYSSVVKQLSCEQTKTADLEIRICELESERKNFKDQIAELTSRLENVESIGESSSSVLLKRLELRNKELESKLELEQANRARMEVQLQRHKDSSEKLQQEINQSRSKEIHTQDAFKKAQKTIRELQQELHTGANKEQECLLKRKDLEKKLESIEAEACSTRADLRLALQRIADLQQAMEEGDSYHSDSENSDTSGESIESMRYSCQNNVPSKETSGLINGSNVNDSNALFCVEEGATITPRITVTSSIVANSKSIYNEYSESQSRTHLVNGDKSNKDPSSA
ncbi:unconventional myosin-XVIIIa isoform X1 [Wyeomyia smithii]|uniref:unconventional myosin-XVIIIa isoform X1 n=2 Tax=Wyeomyia smithii TaxID=174621 RepID=UPI0024681ECE|nr:unconventional myosin-XVIIIa isoform X1 [Wyeomyia smithii]